MMHARIASLTAALTFLFASMTAAAQQTAPAAGTSKPTHEDTEFYKPVPPVVTPASVVGQPPSDAVVLFDGKDV